MLEVAFAAGLLLSPLFWLCFLVSLVVMVTLVENDWPGVATLLVIAGFALLWYYGGVNVITGAWAHPWKVVVAAGLWLTVGTLWSGYAWRVFNYDEAARFKRDVERGYTNAERQKDYKPNRLKLTHKFYGWIMFWPLDMLWYVCSRWFKDLIQGIVNRLGFYYDRMAAGAWES